MAPVHNAFRSRRRRTGKGVKSVLYRTLFLFAGLPLLGAILDHFA